MTGFLTKFAALAALIAITACNTVEGLGRDIEAGGDAVGDATEDLGDDD